MTLTAALAVLGSAAGTVTAATPAAASQTIVGAANDVNGGGWTVSSNGAVTAFGGAPNFGSAVGSALEEPIVGMAATGDGGGYWLVAADGGVFAYGDARFFGSTGAVRLNEPIVGMAATGDGGGYWLVAADGGVFAYGDARFLGSPAGINPVPVVTVLAGRDSYTLVTSTGQEFPYGPGAASPSGPVTPPGSASRPATPAGAASPAHPVATAPVQSAAQPGSVFASSWGRPLPMSTTVAPGSATVVGNFVRQYQDHYGSVGVNDGDYGIPVFTATAADPMVPLTMGSYCPSWAGNFLAGTGTEVPIPSDAVPAQGSDGSLVVYQPSTSTEWELWQARRNPDGSWSACSGGKLTGLGTSAGTFPVAEDGQAASGISYLGTVVSEADIQAGSIDHVLALAVVDCNGMVAPATRNDCGSSPGQPAEGMWFRLPAGLPMPSGLTPFAQMVFRALQQYGAVVTDHSGAVMVQTEDSADWSSQGHSGVDPITESFAGQPEYSALDGMPWSSMQVIEPPQG